MTEAPQGIERRLVYRVLAYWRGVCGERDLPQRQEFDAAGMGEMWPHTCFLDVAAHPRDPVIREIGEILGGTVEGGVVGCPVSAIDTKTLLGHAVSYCDDVLAKRVPISRGGEFINRRGLRTLYRSILVPLSSDGAQIDMLLGAANCREISDL